MFHALSMIAAAAEGEHESSKTAFYVAGGLLALWAVAVSVVGMTRATFPGNAAGERGVQLVSLVLVVAAMATIIITA